MRIQVSLPLDLWNALREVAQCEHRHPRQQAERFIEEGVQRARCVPKDEAARPEATGRA